MKGMLRNAVALSHFYMEQLRGEVYIDATCGNGNDTAFLAGLAGKHVYAFDVQPQAVENTKRRLAEQGLADRATVILDSHANLLRYVSVPVDGILFNLGRLPGSDHAIYTSAESTIAAIEAGLSLLKKDGIIGVSAYWGDEICAREARQVRQYLEGLDQSRAEVLMHQFINERRCPPIFFAICKAG